MSARRGTLWSATARPRPEMSAAPPAERVDVAVIGAGFTGLTAALHLAGRGRSVAVLEAGRVGDGASGANAGFAVPNFAKADPARVVAMLGEARGRRLLELVGAGADRVFETARRHGIACDAEQVGWLHVPHDAASAAMLEARAAAWAALGRPVRMLGEREARALTGARHCVGALLDESAGMLHPLDYCLGLAAAAMAAGATVHERMPVGAVHRDGDAWRVELPGRAIRARSVLLCTNAFPTGVAARLYRRIVPLVVYQIATAPVSAEVAKRVAPRRHPIADTRANLFTYRLDRDDRLISGGMAVLPIAAEGRMARMIAGRLARELGLDSVPEVEHVWRGTAAMTMDFIPHLYRFGPGFFGGIGCNGRGIPMTAMLGEVLADAAEGADPETLPVPLAPGGGVPFHALARAAPSVAVAQARLKDWRAGL